MKCYELPNPAENEDDLELLLDPESNSDTEPCTTDDELSEDGKSSSGEKCEEKENENSDGIVLYLSKPGTSFWDGDNDNPNGIRYSWRSLPHNDSLPPSVQADWNQLGFPNVNLGPDPSLYDCLNQYPSTRVNWDQDSSLRDRSSQNAPPCSYLNQNSPPRGRLSRLAPFYDPLDQNSLLCDPSNQYATPYIYCDQNQNEDFSRPVPFRVSLDQDSPPRDHYSHLVQDTPPNSYYNPNVLPRSHLTQNSSPRNLLNCDLPRPLFHDMIYNRDEFLARQSNPNNRRNFVAASNMYQSYLDMAEEADNERLATNAAGFPQN